MSTKKINEPTGLDRKMFGETIGYWAKLAEADRLADTRIGKKRIGPLNEAVAAALGIASITDATPPVIDSGTVVITDPTPQVAHLRRLRPVDDSGTVVITDSTPQVVHLGRLRPVDGIETVVITDPTPPAVPNVAAPVDSQSIPDASHAAADEGGIDEPIHETIVEQPVITPMPGSPTIADILRDLATAPDPAGHKSRSPMCRLTPGQSDTQAKLFHILEARGVKLRTQGDVYAWLLDNVTEATW